MPAAKGFNMIYYVEDDDNIRDLTVYALRKQGIEAEGFSCDGEFKAAVARRVPDAVLLDIMLPDTDGLAIMRRLRADRLGVGHEEILVLAENAMDAIEEKLNAIQPDFAVVL